MEIRAGSLDFPSTRGSGPRVVDATVRFARDVREAVAGMVGYSATFGNRDDHHLGGLQVRLETFIDSTDRRNVVVRGTFGLRDWSGTWDDAYSGNVSFVVLGELVPATPPAPGASRGDLIVTDLEVTQAVQHFRSERHLDSANVFPDNSIRLVADKPTGVRVYVDYDRASGLPVIASLSGELEVVPASGMPTRLAPVSAITPRRDNQVLRADASHTLNFLVPEGLCRGTVTLRCRVFSAANPNAFSETFERQVSFAAAPPLRVFAVGINYTGTDVTDPTMVAAPPMAAFTSVFALTELLYPIPSVDFTGYRQMDYGRAIKSDISKGCDRFNDLLSAVRDLRGDSTDLFYGLLNSGVDVGSVGGCGGGGMAAVGLVNADETAAHEVGHVLGRRHAPCDNVTRCARPKNTDDAYPRYSGYDSDSIGEYGFDTRSGSVLEPGVFHDFMGYSGNRWISPYTYKALLSRVPLDGAGGGSPAWGASLSATVANPARRTVDGEWIPLKAEHLFLELTIHRDRTVEMPAAFHFPAWPQPADPVRTSFVVEFRDADGRVLVADCLYDKGSQCGCCGGEDLWPRRIWQGVPFDPAARTLVILEGDTPIHHQEIPGPPKVRLTLENPDRPADPELRFSWAVDGPGGGAALWYLVQWRDGRGTWRGVAPRTRERRMGVPRHLFANQVRAAVRVLATSGIATGVAVWEGELGRRRSATPAETEVVIVLPEAGGEESGPVPLPRVLRVSVLDRHARSVAAPEVAWYSGAGAELGRGRTFDLGTLPEGTHTLRAVVLDTGQGRGSRSWRVERAGDTFLLHPGAEDTQGR